MSRRHLNSTDNAELRAKIDEARPRLALPELMRRMGYPEKHIGKTAYCPFHSDEYKSFSVFHSKDGKGWQWKCHAGCGHGDEIAFLVKALNISRSEAIRRYLEMAGFPACSMPKSHEYPASRKSREVRACPKFPKSPEYPVFPVHPVSEGQGLQEELKELAAQNACTERSTGRKRRWDLLRELKAVEKRSGHNLTTAELMLVFGEWYRLSLPFLDPAKTRDDYLALFLAEFDKVRVPTGEGATLDKALTTVSMLPVAELPAIPGHPCPPESWRRIAGLHCELFRLSAKEVYFLSYRDAAKVCDGLTHQAAHTITFALAKLGVIEIVRKGKAGLDGGKAAEFRYVLLQGENPAVEDAGFDL